MRRLLLLAALCMVAALVFAPAAMAQDVDCSEEVPQAQEQAILDADPSDPNLLDDDNDGIACEEPTDGGSTASPEASVDPCPDPNFPRETPDGCQASDLPDVEFGDDSTAAVTAEADDESATATATAEADDEGSASASALPDTGGVVPPATLSVIAALLLVSGGLVSASIARRR